MGRVSHYYEVLIIQGSSWSITEITITKFEELDKRTSRYSICAQPLSPLGQGAGILPLRQLAQRHRIAEKSLIQPHDRWNLLRVPRGIVGPSRDRREA